MRPLPYVAALLVMVAAGAVASASPTVQTVLCSSIFIENGMFGCNVAGSPAPVSSSTPIAIRTAGPTPVRTAQPVVIAPTLAPTVKPTIPPPTPNPTATPLPEPTSVPTSAGLIRADRIADMIGGDSHFNYGNTAYTTNPAIKQLILASGIRHLRDAGAPWSHNLVALGVTDTAAQMEAKRKANPNSDASELCGNEYDNNGDKNWPATFTSMRDSRICSCSGLGFTDRGAIAR